jgi:hypothetical protein
MADRMRAGLCLAGSDLADSFCFAILFYTLVIYNASTIALSGQNRHSIQEPVSKRKQIV